MKSYLGLLLCLFLNSFSMDKIEKLASNSLSECYKSGYKNWLVQNGFDDSIIGTAWYISGLINLEIHKLEKGILQSRAALKMAAVDAMPFELMQECLEEGIDDRLFEMENDLASIARLIKQFRDLKNELTSELKIKSKL